MDIKGLISPLVNIVGRTEVRTSPTTVCNLPVVENLGLSVWYFTIHTPIPKVTEKLRGSRLEVLIVF